MLRFTSPTAVESEEAAMTQKILQDISIRADGLFRIKRMLQRHYDKKFAADCVSEIDLNSVTTEEVTNLVISLQRKFDMGTTMEAVKEQIEPLIAKNPNRIKQKLDEQAQQISLLQQQINELESQTPVSRSNRPSS